jgi:hypothetical protein
MNNKRRLWLGAALAVAAMMGMASNARADVQFMVTGPGGFSMTSAVMPGANGSFTVNIPGFGQIDVNSVASNSPGGPADSFMDLTWRVRSDVAGFTGGGTFVITASANNFTFPPLGPANGLFNNSGNVTGGGTETGQTWVLNTNTLLALAPNNFNSGAVPFGVDVPFTTTLGANPYAITERITVTLPPNGEVGSGDFVTRVTPGAVIPEPASLALLLVGGLPVVGVVSRRLRKKNA